MITRERFRRFSRPLRHGLGLGGAAPAFVPTDVASLEGWWDSAQANVFQNSDGTGAVTAADDPVGYKTDLSGNGLHRIQATAAARPLWTTAPALKFDGSDDRLAGTAVSLTGVFTTYAIGAVGSVWLPHASLTDASRVELNAGTVYVVNNAGSFVSAAAALSGTALLRVRRTAANEILVAGTGVAEVSAGTLAGTLDLTSIGRRSDGFETSANATHAVEMMFSADLVATGNSANVESYIAAAYGASL